MKNVNIVVNKANVYNEVAKTSSYTGAKMKDDETAYERIFTTDDDRLLLERFWTECCSMATDNLKRFIVDVSDNSIPHGIDLSKNYSVQLELSSSFDTSLSDSISSSLFSFFVSAIISKWYMFANKGEAEVFANEATYYMNDVMKKIYFKKKPTRIIPK